MLTIPTVNKTLDIGRSEKAHAMKWAVVVLSLSFLIPPFFPSFFVQLFCFSALSEKNNKKQ